MMTNTTEENQQMLEDCFNREDKLTDWERGYIDTTQNYMDRKGRITEPQEEILERIWNRITS
jgi:hypothetical protein